MIKKKVVALVLSATVIVANLPISTVFAADIKRTSMGTGLNLEKIKSEAMELYANEKKEEGNKKSDLYTEEAGKTLNPNDNVRVIVTLKEGKGITKGIAAKENSKIQTMALNKMKSSNVDFNVRYQFTDEVNTITGDIKYGDIDKIEALDNVVSVRLAREYKANLNNSNSMIQAQRVWEEYGYKGEGMVVAVLDSGFQVDHPDFVLGEEGRKQAKLTEENLKGILDSTEVDDIYYNEKVPTGYDWANKDNDISPVDHPFYANHGMHVAGIVGANGDVENGGVKGIAPEVQIVGEKIFADDGKGYEDDIIAGINHAVLVGADVINMSLGSDAGFVLEDSDLMQIAIQKASEAGVLVVVAAGNSYYSTKELYSKRANPYTSNFDTGTVGDPSVSSYALSVASVDNSKITANVAELSNGEKIEYLNQVKLYPIITEVLGDKEYEIVKVDGLRDKDFEAVDCKGKIALITADDPYYINSGLQSTAKRYGVEGIIVYGLYTNKYNVDSYYKVPVVATNQENGEKLIKALEDNETVKVKFTDKTTLVSYIDNVTTSEFSSWGTTSTLDFKPEVAGVGGEIYSTTPDSEHTTMSGTSMASPQIAGAAAILLQSMKEEGVDINFEAIMDAKNILMNNTEIIEELDADAPYSPRRQGAGLLQLGNALNPSLMVYNADAEIQKKGAIELKEIGNSVDFNLALDPLVDKSLDYDVYVDLYTDGRENADIDINMDGITDFTKEVTQLKSRKINGAKVAIDGTLVEDGKAVNIKDLNTNKVLNVSIDLSNADIKDKSYVEGYIRVVPKSEDYSEVSIPLMGFYGDWNDAPNIDEPMVNGHPYAEYTAIFGYDSDIPLGFDRDEGKIIEDKVTFSPKGVENLVGPSFTALRNLKHVSVVVEDETGNLVKELFDEEYLNKNTFYNRNIFYSISNHNPWDATDEEGNIVEDGMYNFVIRSTFAYEGAKEQETKMSVKVDGTDPTVSDVNITKVGEKYEITFEVIDETSGYNGAILYIDGEYTPLPRGEKSYVVDEIPKELVVIGFDNAGNAGLGVYGESKEVSAETLLIYYNVYGSGVNYENPASMFGAAQKSMTWKLSIVGPTGDVVYELDNFVDTYFNMQFTPKQGEPNGIYTVTGYLLDEPTGIYAKLEDYQFDVANNEIYDKTGLFNAIMAAKEFIADILVGEEVGQYPQKAVDEYNEILNSVIDTYYDPEANENDLAAAIEDLNNAKETLESKANPSEGKASAIKLLAYCDKLISEAIIGDRPGNYSQESVDALKEAMKELQGLVSSEEKISDEIFNEAIAKLNIQIKSFLDSAVKAGDVTDIANLINEQRQYLETVKKGESKEKYTKEAVEKLETLLNKCEADIKEPLTAEEVEAKYKALKEAIKEFKSGKIDVGSLERAIEKGKNFLEKIDGEKDLYDAEAIETLKTAIAAGEKIILAPYTTEEEVNKAISTINIAIKSVKDSKQEPSGPSEPSEPSDPDDPSEPSDPSDPDDPSEPSNPSDPGDSSEPSAPSKPSNPSKPVLPQTGAMIGGSLMAVAGVAVVGAGMIMIKRKNK